MNGLPASLFFSCRKENVDRQLISLLEMTSNNPIAQMLSNLLLSFLIQDEKKKKGNSGQKANKKKRKKKEDLPAAHFMYAVVKSISQSLLFTCCPVRSSVGPPDRAPELSLDLLTLGFQMIFAAPQLRTAPFPVAWMFHFLSVNQLIRNRPRGALGEKTDLLRRISNKKGRGGVYYRSMLMPAKRIVKKFWGHVSYTPLTMMSSLILSWT